MDLPVISYCSSILLETLHAPLLDSSHQFCIYHHPKQRHKLYLYIYNRNFEVQLSFYLENNSQVHQPLTTEVYWVYTWLTNHDPKFQTSHARLRKPGILRQNGRKSKVRGAMDRLRFFLFTVFFFSTWLHFSAAMINRACHQRSWNGGASTELLQLLPTNMWRIWRFRRQVGKNETPRFEGKKTKNTKKNMSKSNTWMIMILRFDDCYIVLQIKQLLYFI